MLNKKDMTNTQDVKTKDIAETKKEPKFLTRFSILIASLKFLWFVGHVVVIYNTIVNTTIAKFNSNFSSSYHKALLGVIISNSVILYKTHGIPDLASSWFENICRDENFHYLVIAIIFIFTKPLFFLLFPYACYSLFHIANFIYAEFLSRNPQSRIAVKLYNFISKYQDYVIKKVAQYEIFIALPMVFVAAIFRQVTLLSVLIYARFLYMRYYISPVVRNVWKEFQNFCTRKVDNTTRDSNVKPIPKGAKYVYYAIECFFKDFLFPLDRLQPSKKVAMPAAPVESSEEVPTSPVDQKPVEVKN
ncbi:hypothetical protein BCR32DRAFT_266376 [Anaeromyces robustus]|jgi:hypothetical protein|uniref:Uncharacterized protein n=1 Tax=Anaeromyces robustus TaxID=1754192 RepID=A0A1Y1XEZ7_9FUNG|nr:hypothetical protein BCR32DRAFT_266376 [Anaeromyces robustus]|eukprot:ORX84329.1 hypothetical protein BCR32DRAFT_266376 [Anaeromyces robustus]